MNAASTPNSNLTKAVLGTALAATLAAAPAAVWAATASGDQATAQAAPQTADLRPSPTGSTAKGDAASDKDAYTKKQVVYSKLSPEGKVSGIYVSNIFNATSDCTVRDAGAYQAVINQSDNQQLSNTGGAVTFDATAGNTFYYQGNLAPDKELPWNIEVAYQLDGKTMSPEEIAGKSGDAKIKLKITRNSQCKQDYPESYLIQVSTTLGADTFSDIDAPDATVALSGSNTALTYMLLPDNNASYAVTAHADNFEFDGFQIVGLPMSMALDYDSFDTSELTDSVDELEDAISRIDDGADSLSNGAEKLSSGASKVDDGSDKLDDGAQKLKDGAKSLKSGADSANDGAASVSKGAKKLNSGIGTLYTQTKSLPSSALQLATGASKLSNGLDTINSNMPALKAGAKSLTAGLKSAVAAVGASDDQSTLLGGSTAVGSAMETADNYLGKALDEDALNAEEIMRTSQEAMQAAVAYQKAYNALGDSEKGSAMVSAYHSQLGSVAEALAKKAQTLNATAASIESKTLKAQNSIADTKGSVESASSTLDGINTEGMTDEQKAQIAAAKKQLSAASSNADDASSSIDAVGDTASDVRDAAELAEAASDNAKSAKSEIKELAAQSQSDVAAYLEKAGALQKAATEMEKAIGAAGQQENLTNAITNVKYAQGYLEGAMGGNTKITSGLKNLKSGLQEAKTGSESISTGINRVSTGIGKLADGASELSDGTSLLSKSAPQLVKGVKKLNTGSKKLAGGSMKLAKGTKKLSGGAESLSDGASTLAAGAKTLASGTSTLSAGASTLASGSATLAKGTSKLASKTDGLSDRMVDGIRDSLDDLLNPDVKAVDFVSDSNDGNLDSVQFVYKTQGITTPDETPTQEDAFSKNQGFLERLVALFSHA